MKDNPLNRINAVRGSQHYNAKLTESDIELIRALIEHREELKKSASELTNAKIAEKFGVHQRTIERVTQGFGWVHV